MDASEAGSSIATQRTGALDRSAFGVLIVGWLGMRVRFAMMRSDDNRGRVQDRRLRAGPLDRRPGSHA